MSHYFSCCLIDSTFTLSLTSLYAVLLELSRAAICCFTVCLKSLQFKRKREISKNTHLRRKQKVWLTRKNTPREDTIIKKRPVRFSVNSAINVRFIFVEGDTHANRAAVSRCLITRYSLKARKREKTRLNKTIKVER